MLPRFIKLHPRTKSKLIEMLRESSTDGAYRVSKRINAVLLNNEEKTSGEIAMILNSSPSAVSDWLKTYEDQGIDGLMEGKRSGRPNRLNELQKILLCDIIDSGPIAYGLMTGIWTSTNIAQIIENELEVKYHPGHVRKILQEFGFSVQTPTRLLAAANKEKKDKWVSQTFPNIKKKPGMNLLE